MLKLKINCSLYYVGGGVEMRRLWKKAVHAGYAGYKGDTTPPKFDIKGTYALEFVGKTMYWYNFKTIAKVGQMYFDKKMPDYKQYKGRMVAARSMYSYKKENR